MGAMKELLIEARCNVLEGGEPQTEAEWELLRREFDRLAGEIKLKREEENMKMSAGDQEQPSEHVAVVSIDEQRAIMVKIERELPAGPDTEDSWYDLTDESIETPERASLLCQAIVQSIITAQVPVVRDTTAWPQVANTVCNWPGNDPRAAANIFDRIADDLDFALARTQNSNVQNELSPAVQCARYLAACARENIATTSF